MGIYEIVYHREQAILARGNLNTSDISAEKHDALVLVYEAAQSAVARLNALGTPWPEGQIADGYYCMNRVITPLETKKPLYLGDDGKLYRPGWVNESEFVLAPIHLRRNASDILHLVQFLDMLG